MKCAIVGLSLLLTACANTTDQKVQTWAASVTKPVDRPPSACDRQPSPPVIPAKPMTDDQAARAYREAVQYGVEVLKAHDVCSEWARGQRS